MEIKRMKRKNKKEIIKKAHQDVDLVLLFASEGGIVAIHSVRQFLQKLCVCYIKIYSSRSEPHRRPTCPTWCFFVLFFCTDHITTYTSPSLFSLHLFFSLLLFG